MTDKTRDAGITHYFTPEQEARERMRAEFEAVGRAKGWRLHRRDVPGADGSYVNPAVETAWEAYQACAAHYSARQNAELEALRIKANTAEKWKGIALAQDGDGRTVAQIEAPLREQVAAAQADSARLREALPKFRPSRQQYLCEDSYVRDRDLFDALCAQPLDTTALDAHVEEKTAELRTEVERLKTGQCTGHFRKGCNYMSQCNTVCNKCGNVHEAEPAVYPHDNVEIESLRAELDGIRAFASALRSQDQARVAMLMDASRQQDYVDDYEFRGDYDYQPSETERMLIMDALIGYLDETLGDTQQSAEAFLAEHAAKMIREFVEKFSFEDAVNNYRCQHFRDDEDGGGVGLADALCAGGIKFADAETEIELLADHIGGAMLDDLRKSAEHENGKGWVK